MGEKSKTTALNPDVTVTPTLGSVRKRERSKSRQKLPNKTPEHYAFDVEKLAHKSTASTLYPGVHFEKIADFLTAPYRSNLRGNNTNDNGSGGADSVEGCITVYNFRKNEPPEITSIRTKEELEREACGPFAAEYTGRMLFLQGHQNAEWLNHIGARYSVDYEFFRRHMDFDSLKQNPATFVRRKLPSDFSNMIQISLTTLGSRYTPEDSMTGWYQEDIGTMRRRLDEFIQDGLQKLANPHKYDGSYGESMLRRFTIHDGHHFSLEQDISVYVGDVKGFWVVIVWSDFGHDLCRDTLAGVLRCEADDVRCLPTTPHVPSSIVPSTVANPRNQSSAEEHGSLGGKATISQNISCLARCYGQYLDNDLMAVDTFYLVTDIFRLFIASEAEFLVMLQLALEQELEISTDEKKGVRKTLALLHLDYNRQCLLRHFNQLERLHALVAAQASLEWPRANAVSAPEWRAKVDKTAGPLERDLAALVRDAKMLSKSFDAGMNLLMNSAITDESQRAIAQAERVTKLTALAFFFIPLSFTASVFGMNFKEFTDNTGSRLHIWVWVLTSLAVTLLAYFSLNMTAFRLKARMLSLVRRRKAVASEAV